MKFLSKDTNFNQVIMLSEFEKLDKSLMVEIIRLKQTPRKMTNIDQMTDLITSIDVFNQNSTNSTFKICFS